MVDHFERARVPPEINARQIEKEFDAAIESCQKILEQLPQHPRTLEELVKVFQLINDKLKSGDGAPLMSPFEGVTDEDIDRIFGE